jgi:hypothetical protein
MRRTLMPDPRSPKPLDLSVSLTPDDRVRRHPRYYDVLWSIFSHRISRPDGGDAPPDIGVARAAPPVAPDETTAAAHD